tara:strand:- start:1691 stop:2947 length:1257 start_codon:yes stop_codon:yes gene_type:complete
MATTFKTLKSEDKVLTRNVLHEAIPITGSILSGTYGTFVTAETSIKNYSHGMFQSVFDYPFLSSSANHIFDITVGNSGLSGGVTDAIPTGFASSLSGTAAFQMGDVTSTPPNTTAQASTRHNIYAQMAQVLCGHFADGTIRPFDSSGDLSRTAASTDTMEDVFFLNFARLLTKDEIKKGTFELEIGTNATYTTPFTTTTAKITDTGAASSYKVNSPAGEFGVLQIANATGSAVNATKNCGLIFYQAGIVVLTGSIFQLFDGGNPADGIADTDFNGSDEGLLTTAPDMNAGVIPMGGARGGGNLKVREMMAQSSISSSADALRNRIKNISFNNTTELNSTVYFCRANAHEFNYSSNPTYLSGSQIRVRDAANPDAEPVAYVTTVGLYGKNNELLAVAKTSEPLKKSPSNELTLRVRLDY